ncbi:OpgC domain-containing protein [Roseomonas stagni]|uniref:OpgC domain-containing protein n=1 Tax=Falsiroseomonas algicola TaxID=2716930 RepID=A0A6M1LUP0_9PROT|nr:OpgC domain-containing protein [Falsiroseomonas algicola]NGM23917.1 OpgC domain-containing protein [Falsiroseomonas algicola]
MQREWRIDLFRGLALVMIFVNHIPDNPLTAFTTAAYGFSDAAEGFVLMAGIAAGLVFLKRLDAGGGVAVTAQAWRRAFDLYAAHLLTVLLACAIVAHAASAQGDPRLLGWVNLGPVFDDTAAALVGVVLLGHQPGYLNILPLYIVFLLLLPALLPLAAARPRALLLASGLVWAVANHWNLNLPHYPNEDGWFFNPLAWQFLFVIGLVIGTRMARGLPVVPRSNTLLALAVGYLLVTLVISLDEELVWPVLPLPWFLYGLDKTWLTLPRLLHALALALVLARLPVAEALAALDRRGVLVMLGRNALPVFCAGSVLAIGAQVARFVWEAGVALEMALVLGGIAIQVALAATLAWMDRGRKAPARPKLAEGAATEGA